MLAVALLMVLASPLHSASAGDYLDSKGRTVSFPLGAASFADEVVNFTRGSPAAADRDSQAPESLGPPDYDKKKKLHYVTLGCGGSLTLRFTDNALIDVEGPDLYVFEVGPDVEATNLAISIDGAQWIEVGKIAGGRTDVDISRFVKADEAFHFVRLTDLKSGCGSKWPGADIDAVGTIGGGLVISLKSAVLFDVDSATLKPDAERELSEAVKVIRQHPGARLRIDGHTDNTGSSEHNLALSEKRAQTVADYFAAASKSTLKPGLVRGYGETRPIAPNETEEGRGRNRRVEIIILPGGGK